MNAKDFKDLTGENPEDVFGGDWQESMTDLEEVMPKDHQNRCAGCAECEYTPIPKQEIFDAIGYDKNLE